MGRVLSQINPSNVIVFYTNSEKIKGSVTEKFFGGKYKIESLPKRIVYVNNFTTLPRNEFLPVDIKLKPENNDKKVPRQIS